MDFSHILKEYDIPKDKFEYILKKFGKIESLDVKSSNDSSLVFISNESENVYQYFKYNNRAKYIFNLLNFLSKNKICKIKFDDVINMEYNLFDYIARFVSYLPNNILVWKKHTCLNSFNKEKIKKIIINNITKLLWDIGLCLVMFNNNRISHGDPTIDNIGIIDNKFILYDFDGSEGLKPLSINRDLYKFINSIKFNLDNEWKNIKNYIPTTDCLNDFLDDIIYREHKKNNTTYFDEIIRFDNMRIII